MTGSRILLLDEVSSTNDFLQELRKSTPSLPHGTVVWTVNQTNGKGQMGNVWLSEPGKNLMFSIFMSKNLPAIHDKFRLTMEISLTVLQYLRSIHTGEFVIKWPNDVLLNHKKVCGMLLENSVSNSNIQYIIAGIGINLNQSDFRQLPNAGSLYTADGIYREPESVLQGFIEMSNSILPYYHTLTTRKLTEIYCKEVYGYKDEVAIRKGNQILRTRISGINTDGMITLEKDDEAGRTYSIKELEFLLQPS